MHGQLFNPTVFSSWERIREIIEPAYQRITSYPLDYEVQLVDQQTFDTQGLRAETLGVVQGEKATVVLPEGSTPSAVAEFYSILFHELGHLTFLRGGGNSIDRFFEETTVPPDYLNLSGSNNAKDFFRMLGILHTQYEQVLEDAWTFERMIDESRASTFSLLLGSSIFDKSTLKLFAQNARDEFVASSELYDRYSTGAYFQKSIVAFALLRKNEGDCIKTMADFNSLKPSELAQLVLDLARSEGMLAVVANVNESLSTRYGITPYAIEPLTEALEEDLGEIGKKNDSITNLLKAVSAPGFDEKVQKALRFYSTGATLEFIRAIVQKDYEKAIQALEEIPLREKDRVLFLLADALSNDSPQASQRLFQKVVDVYPRSPWRYRAQHRIER